MSHGNKFSGPDDLSIEPVGKPSTSPQLPVPASINTPPIPTKYGPNDRLASVLAGAAQILRSIAIEIKEIGSATAAQSVRLFNHAKALLPGHSLKKALEDSRFRLGMKMYEAGVGDASLVRQIAELSKQMADPNRKKGLLKMLKDKRRQLALRLADSALNQGIVCKGAQTEYRESTTIQAEIVGHASCRQSQWASLPPHDALNWRRVCFGYGSMALVMVGLFLLEYCGPITTKTNSANDLGIPQEKLTAGIGARIEVEGEYPVVKELIVGSSAAMSGLLEINDCIEFVGEEASGPMLDMRGRAQDEVTAFIRGKHGSSVRLTVKAPGATSSRTVSLIRTSTYPAGSKIDEIPGPKLIKDGRETFILDVNFVRRFPGSQRYYQIQNNQSELKAFTEKFVGKRVCVVSQLLFPEVNTKLGRVELRMFHDMDSPLAIAEKHTSMYDAIVRNDPQTGDIAIMHLFLRLYSDSKSLYGEIEEIMFVDSEKPDAGIFLGVSSNSDGTSIALEGMGSEPSQSPPRAITSGPTKTSSGLARLGCSKAECLICGKNRSASAAASYSDGHGYGLCEQCGRGVALLKQAKAITDSGQSPPPELFEQGQEFGAYLRNYVHSDDSEARRGLILMILAEFGTKDWDTFYQ